MVGARINNTSSLSPEFLLHRQPHQHLLKPIDDLHQFMNNLSFCSFEQAATMEDTVSASPSPIAMVDRIKSLSPVDTTLASSLAANINLSRVPALSSTNGSRVLQMEPSADLDSQAPPSSSSNSASLIRILSPPDVPASVPSLSSSDATSSLQFLPSLDVDVAGPSIPHLSSLNAIRSHVDIACGSITTFSSLNATNSDAAGCSILSTSSPEDVAAGSCVTLLCRDVHVGSCPNLPSQDVAVDSSLTLLYRDLPVDRCLTLPSKDLHVGSCPTLSSRDVTPSCEGEGIVLPIQNLSYLAAYTKDEDGVAPSTNKNEDETLLSTIKNLDKASLFESQYSNATSVSTSPSPDFLLERIRQLELNHAMLKSEISEISRALQEHKTEGETEGINDDTVSKYFATDKVFPSYTGFCSKTPKLKFCYAKNACFTTQKQVFCENQFPYPTSVAFPQFPTEQHYMNILQCIGRAVYIFNTSAELTYWNRYSEHLFGYMAKEALGCNIINLIVPRDYRYIAYRIALRLVKGEHWNGLFPLVKKSGEVFMGFVSNSPLHDDDGKLIGIIGVTHDPQDFSMPFMICAGKSSSSQNSIGPGSDQQQDNSSFKDNSAAATVNCDTVGEENLVNSNASVNIDEQSSSSSTASADSNTSSSTASSHSFCLQKLEAELDTEDCEVEWESLYIREVIGRGSCGTVYRASLFGSDVAVKVFSERELTREVIEGFRKEVSIMKKLRHPNVLLFMGSVLSPEHLAIVTEFLPRGSLYRLIQRNTPGFDWRRRVRMAYDVALGMNHLHHMNPPILHRDLKSSNLLVDKNWTVKVADFGLSKIKSATYVRASNGRGTPQWMAPEVLRNEQIDEKSDVYSFGVILWELATDKTPWEELNPVQVLYSVGFENKTLEIPETVDPKWSSMMKDCWHSDPRLRPTFEELAQRLKEIYKQLPRP